MDYRWQPISRDSAREAQIILHPTAAIEEVRRGMDPGSDDSINLTEFVKDASHTCFDANVTLVFNRELFGYYQPKPNQVLEVQLKQNNEWKPLWLGHVDAITSFTMQRGERSMQMTAKTREQQDIWKNAPRVTPLFPQLTNLTYIAQRVARTVGLKGDEIVLPPSSISTPHANSQMVDMPAWDMLTTIFLPLGWTPFIDGVGRLRAADRSLQGRRADAFLTDDRMVKVGGSRQRPPKSRVRLTWLDPVLRRWEQQRRKVGDINLTLGWWQIWHNEDVKFSEDETLRVREAKLKQIQGLNNFITFCTEEWTQTSPTKGHFHVNNAKNFALMATLMGAMVVKQATRVDFVAGNIPVGDPPLLINFAPGFGAPNPSLGDIPVVGTPGAGTLFTVPSLWTGSISESLLSIGLFAAFMNIGTGVYEIWGTPYDYVHAKNISEAFDQSVPTWVSNVEDISCDYIVNEEHAKAVAIRELVYQARAANKWSVTIVDDPRIEYGDILEFPDGTQLYVEDFTRRLERGSDAVLDIQGFLVGPLRSPGVSVIGGLPGEGVPPGTMPGPGGGVIGQPGGPGGGPGHVPPGSPPPAGGAPGSSSSNPIIAMSLSTIEANVTASHAHFAPLAMAKYGKDIGSVSYWVGKASTPEEFSNKLWYQGWNRYWEDRMDPDNPGFLSGSADPSHGSLPSIYQ